MVQNKKLKNFPSKSAGRMMVEKVPIVLPTQSILDLKKMVIEKLNEWEASDYIYVVDQNGKLIGTLSLKEVFNAPEETKVDQVMGKEIIKVSPLSNQENVATLALQHDLKAIPVVSKENKFLGVVPSRVIFDILHSEHVEDFLKAAGIHSLPTKTLEGSVSFLIKVRLPWLILGIIGGVIAAQITKFFETPLKAYFILAAFVPLIVYMADAIGTQTETLFVRSLALRKINLKNYIFREIKVGFGIASILGILLFLIGYFWSNLFHIGLILGVSIFLTGLAGIFVPLLIVHLLDKFKKDPAIASGPLATIFQDIISLAIYFSVAVILLKFFS